MADDVTIKHADVTAGVHRLYHWSEPNAAARLALAVTATHEGRVCRQTDDNSYWLLTTSAPVTWKRVDGEGSGGGGGGGWTTALDVNLMQASAYTFVDGAQTWLGLPVTGKNIASGALTAAVQPGTGLVIQLNTTSTDIGPAADTGPSLRIPLLSLAPEFVLGSSRLRLSFQWRTINADADFEVAMVGLRKMTFVANQEHWFRFSRGHHGTQGGSAYHRCAVLLGSTETMIASGIPANNVDVLESDGLEVTFSTKQTTASSTDPNSSAFDAKTNTAIARHAPAMAVSGSALSVAQASDLAVFIGILSANTNRNASVVIERIRVEYTANVGGVPASLTVVDNRITNLSDPVNPQDADTKAARDAAIGWRAALDVNFVTEPAFTFVDGLQTWKGVTVTGVNVASAADVFAIVPGTGLVIDHNATSTDFWLTTNSAPRIQLVLKDMIPGYLVGSTRVRVWCEMANNADQNFEQSVFGIIKVPHVNNNVARWSFNRVFENSFKVNGQVISGTAEYQYPLASPDPVCMIDFVDGQLTGYYSKAATAAATDANSKEFDPTTISRRFTNRYAGGGTTADLDRPIFSSPDSLAVFITAFAANTANNFQATIKRLRIEYKL